MIIDWQTGSVDQQSRYGLGFVWNYAAVVVVTETVEYPVDAWIVPERPTDWRALPRVIDASARDRRIDWVGRTR